MATSMTSLAERLRALRGATGCSQAEIAAAAGLTTHRLAAVEEHPCATPDGLFCPFCGDGLGWEEELERATLGDLTCASCHELGIREETLEALARVYGVTLAEITGETEQN